MRVLEKHWIPLRSVPVTGKTILVDEQDTWNALLKQFGLACRILEPVSARIDVLPQAEGVLFRGRILGTIALPCDRCTSDSIIALDHVFDSFEPFPAEPAPGGGKEEEDFWGERDEAVIRNAVHATGIEINPAALAWEEFSLALPVKPLCEEGCKGLCPVCGASRNSETCACEGDRGDPRLAMLRGLTIKKK